MPNARENVRVPESLSSWMGEQLGQSCTFARMSSARRTDNSLTTKSPHRSGNSGESLRLRFGFRRNRVLAFCRPCGRSFLLHLARADFEMVALDYFRRLGHDNHHRLFQVYGWEEKKTKTSWGGTSVDHEELAEGQIRAMTTADLNRFLVTCALVPDLYCPGYSSAETLSKEANLMKAATRYKVDASKVTAKVAAELSRKRHQRKQRNRRQEATFKMSRFGRGESAAWASPIPVPCL